MRVSEEFYSLQGEGFWAGTAAYFVRLAGCDVGCEWCDSREAWSSAAGFKASAEDIARRAAASGACVAVITGGEPLMQELSELTSLLRVRGMRVHLETSGTHPLSGEFDWVALSPKPWREPLAEAFSRADELKVIIAKEADFEFAVACAARVRESCLLYLQPVWGFGLENKVVYFIKQNPRWRLSVQVHKYLAFR